MIILLTLLQNILKSKLKLNKSKLKNYKNWIEKGYLTRNAKIYY